MYSKIVDTNKQKVTIKCPYCNEKFDQDIEVSFYEQAMPEIDIEVLD